jgi:DNA-directed RNA polymerase specialized sigma24 family protein
MRLARMEAFQVHPAAPDAASSPSSPEHDAAVEEDLVLLAAVRRGDMAAMSALYGRHHAAALRTARGVGGAGLAVDLVSDAFTKVFTSILHGSGPDRLMRPYLATTIRHLYVDRVRKGAHEFLVGDSEVLDRLQPDDTEAVLEESLVVDVLATLPPRWREILWRTIILGEPLSVAGAKMGLNANAAAALNFRARGGLRTAYLARTSARDEEGQDQDGTAGRASAAGSA